MTREQVVFNRRLTALLVVLTCVVLTFVVWWLPAFCLVAALVFRFGIMAWGED